MMSSVMILDATLRDGGLGLEDASNKGLSSQFLAKEDRVGIAEWLSMASVDIIELGSIERSADDKTCFSIYQDMESLSRVAPSRLKHQKCAALYRGPDIPLDDIPNWRDGLTEFVRVIIRYSELQKSLDYCSELSRKGYKVCVQPMLTMRYSPDEISKVVAASNLMHAFALYFVDSYGYMNSADVLHYLKTYDDALDPAIKIGFHAHNNSNLAFSNVKTFLENRGCRDVIVDSCLLGLGQGAGNMQTEILTDYLNKTEGKTYNYDAILEGCELVEKFFASNICGYSVTYLLPALHRAAYKYSVDMRSKYGLTYPQINKVFAHMPYDLKQRYTVENMQKVLMASDLDVKL